MDAIQLGLFPVLECGLSEAEQLKLFYINK